MGRHPLTRIISVSTAELLAGHGQYTLDYLNDYAEQGDLRLYALLGDSGYPYLSCIRCSVNIDFNLIGMQYLGFGTTAMLAMNAADTRALLYQESSYQYEGSYYGALSQGRMAPWVSLRLCSLWATACGRRPVLLSLS